MVALHTLCLLAALTGGPDMVLLEFTSANCPPCKAMQPTIERMVKEGYPIRQIDVEHDTATATRFGIKHVPTCVLVINGQEATRMVGLRTHAELAQLFTQATTQALAAQAAPEEMIVRGQSPEAPRRGLGIFNRLGGMGKPAADPGAPPVQIPTDSGTPDLGQDPAFAARETPAAPSFDQPAPAAQPFAQPQHQPEMAAAPENFSAGSPVAPSDAALAATVRLRVEDAGGHSFGTGTIIDCVKDEALVITCGHIFRESKGQGKIIVDLHAPGAKEPVMGQLISFDLTRDIALVSIRPGVAIKPVTVASDPRRAVETTRVFSIGCDHGREPSVRESRINAVNKYIGAPNYSVAGAPVQGRSGGGLFLADGSLIGICNAADEQGDEGFYVGLPTVHWQLDKIGQTAIYKRGDEQPMASAVASHNAPASEDEMVAIPAFPGRGADATRSAAHSDDREVICIVRSKSQRNAPSEVIVVEQPTVELLDLLARSKQPLGALSNSAQPQPTSFRAPQPEEQQPVVRGQSR